MRTAAVRTLGRPSDGTTVLVEPDGLFRASRHPIFGGLFPADRDEEPSMPATTQRRRHRNPLSLLSALLLVGSTSACLSWHVAEEPPRQVLLTDHPGRVRVTTEDGAQTILIRPRSLGDVMAGFDGECVSNFGRMSNECPEIGIPFFEVTRLEVEKRGAAVIFLPAVGGLLAAWLLANR